MIRKYRYLLTAAAAVGAAGLLTFAARNDFGLGRNNGGFLPLNDDSAPEEVNRLTQTSKKVFKRSLGMLLKRGAVTVDEQGIKINE